MRVIILLALTLCLSTPAYSAILTKTIGTSSRDYSTIQLWEDDLDDGTNAANDATAYSASDDAIGEVYNDSAFDEAIVIAGGATVGLSTVTLTVPSAERHDGTAGTGARIVRTSGVFTIRTTIPNGRGDAYVVEWLEIDDNDQGAGWVDTSTSSAFDNSVFRNMIMHEGKSDGQTIAFKGNNRGALVINCIFYNHSRTTGGTTMAVAVRVRNPNSGIINSTVYNVSNPNGTGHATAVSITDDDADGSVRNTIAMGTTVGGTGTAADFIYPGTNPTITNNMSEDATADDQGTNHLISKTTANQFVSTTGGSEDLHLKSGSDAIDAGAEIGTSPTNVEIDIDGVDRTVINNWDIGVHDFIAAAPSNSEINASTLQASTIN